MWLLDNNVPLKVASILKKFSIPCETTKDREWTLLKNGKLVSNASKAGFNCILTRDKLFRESAAQVLKEYSRIAIVLLTIPQGRGRIYIDAFQAAWKIKPINPIPGKLIHWP